MAKKNPNIDMAVSIQRFIYIGPNHLKLGLVQNRIYKGSPEKIFEAAKETFPLIMQLVVPLEKLGEAQVELRKKGSAIHTAYQQVMGGNE